MPSLTLPTAGRSIVVAIAALVAGVLALSAAAPSVAAAAGGSTGSGTKDVSYRGVTVTVPADWPVRRLAGRAGCVRFDRHAVYLGDPSRITCPPRLVGRTQAVHLTARALQGVVRPDRVVTSDGSRIAAVVAAGDDSRVARRIAGSVRFDGARGDVIAPSGSADARSFAGAGSPSGRRLSGTASRFDATTFTGQGFDACTARPVSELATWFSASPYRAVNMYIGGASRGCSQPNLNASWVTTVVGQGWVLIPTYVGLQAPCREYPNVIDPAQAAAQGSAAADDAITQLNALGLGVGNPVYFDMEAFNYANASCRQAVLDFLGAWTARLHVRGYVSGVYGSAGSTIRALVSQLANPAFAEPDQLWIARWCQDLAACDNSTNDPEVPADQWVDHQRIRQWRGGHTETWGGVTINIDNNTVDAAVSPSQLATNGSFVTIAGRGELYRMAGAAPVYTSSWESVGVGPQPVQTLSQSQFDSLPQIPENGTYLRGGASGNVYRVSNGVATYDPTIPAFGGPASTVTVDQAALDRAGTGGPWDHLVSGPPSVRMTGPTTLGDIVKKARFTWAGGISSSAVKSYDVRWRRASWDGTFGKWNRPASWKRVTYFDAPLGLKAGYTYCVAARARNQAGQKSGWSGQRCLSRALDDRRLSASSGWKTRSGAAYYTGRYVTTTQKGATLSRSGARVKRVGLVATVCKVCGIVVVKIDGKRIKRVNLEAPRKRRRQVIMLPAFKREKGTVTVTVRSSGKRVQIDGLVLSRS